MEESDKECGGAPSDLDMEESVIPHVNPRQEIDLTNSADEEAKLVHSIGGEERKGANHEERKSWGRHSREFE